MPVPWGSGLVPVTTPGEDGGAVADCAKALPTGAVRTTRVRARVRGEGKGEDTCVQDSARVVAMAKAWAWVWVRVRVWVVLHSLALRGLLGCTDDHTYIIVYGGCGAVGLPWVHVTLVHTSSHFSPFLPFFSSSLPHGDCKMAIGSSFTVVQSFTSGWWLNKMVKLVCSLFL